ncbi:hypothetical protein M501DRAFT_986876 [Patellaria atrata CBS 101060]|uniref:Uncharacterized protein n=1 Tax=Patellaria atrata CBS 101060 TaxID=1346257 RepID=A0A9P4S6K2_9PEZI|nr:hypothetical protein M501DRAFT_986876 [Patellaria atrata CBS 101060]
MAAQYTTVPASGIPLGASDSKFQEFSVSGYTPVTSPSGTPYPGVVSIPASQNAYVKTGFKHRWRDLSNRLWLWEVTACAISLVFLGAACGTLAMYDGRTIDEWFLPWKINSVIALFVTLMKTSMMVPLAASISQMKWLHFKQNRKLKDIDTYDQASRGPMGAFFLILSFKMRRIACLGALLVLASLAMDTLTQNVISIRSKIFTSSTPNAWVPRGNLYSVFLRGWSGDDTDPAAPMVASILAGWVSQVSYEDLTVVGVPNECPTGNCTFPTFQTLAVCNRCLEATDLLSTTEEGFVLPDGHAMNNYRGVRGRLNLTSNAILPEYSRLQRDDIGLPIAHIEAISDPTGADRAWASECALYWCILEFQTQVRDGKINQIGNTAPLLTRPTRNETIAELVPEECYIDGEVHDPRSEECVHSVGRRAHLAIKNFFINNVRGFVGNDGSKWTSTNLLAQSLFTHILQKAGNNLHNSLTATVGNMTTFMTNNVRQQPIQTGDNNKVEVYGEYHKAMGYSEQYTSYYHIRWVYMIAPAGIVVLSALFFVLTVLMSLNHQPWKASSLALLFHGLGTRERHALGPVARIVDMKEAAESVHMKMENAYEGLRLVSKDSYASGRASS